MQKGPGGLSAVCVVLAVALGISACGGSSGSSSSSSGSPAQGRNGGEATVLMGTAPDFLDPGLAYTTQGAAADWITYTPLLTYRHAAGKQGGEIIPGLATALPTISKDGKTYTFQLRKGLTYSNGQSVKASDLEYSIRRSIKVNWGGKSFFTNYIVGAAAVDSGKAQKISGITADDATGKITIKLLKAYGAFSNVIAFPAAGLVPTGTKFTNLSNNPPPGVGPYMITAVQPNRTFTMVKNPKWASFNVAGVPEGHLQKITVTINSNTQAEAQQVLNNQADVFDPGDTLPPALLGQIRSTAQNRFAAVTIPSTFYFFMNTRMKPFNNIKVRQAVNYALDKRAMARLASGFLKPACNFLPEGIVGHPTSCPYGDPNAAPDLNKAKQLVQQSGLAGTAITVWGEMRSPRKEYVDYYTDVLNKIGFKATPKIISDSTFFPTIGNEKTKAQTGFADWIQDFPNPSDFYLLLDGTAIQPTNNQNFSYVNDPKIQAQLAKLNTIPTSQLDSVASQWQKLDEYVTSQAYEAVYGSEQVPKFQSNRMNFQASTIHPLYLDDWLNLSLK
jgi:peptide/nickel transport system substrate-binding protein